MNGRDSILSTHPAVIAVWAALIAVVTLVPAFPMIGTGATFSVSAALVPLAGILFGPIPGAICAAIGAFIGQLIAPHTVFFGPLSFLIPTLNALCAGFAMQKRWYVPLVVILALSLVWFAFPLGRSVWFTPLIWTLGIGASLVGWFVGSDWLGSDNRPKLFAGVFLAAMCGTIVDHNFGSLWALIMFKLPR
ncbi:MAG: ECF transporter S component, partial [Anaerolineae bacterium]